MPAIIRMEVLKKLMDNGMFFIIDRQEDLDLRVKRSLLQLLLIGTKNRLLKGDL
ncbi:hypothetical protein D3C81_2228590 [compost metagenome]